ncbi:MAG: class II aldolase/adducin family protein [Candidatus Thorarchaeota archaeon]
MHDEEKQLLVDITMRMLEENLVIGSSGNASLRVEDHVVITPSSVHYVNMAKDDIVILDMGNNAIEGHRNPSVEAQSHLEIYKQREDIRAIVHSHSIYATALAVLRKPLPPILDEVVPKLGGEIRVAEYAMPGTKDLAKNVAKAIEDRSAALLSNHGAFCAGKTLDDALFNAILLERTCRIYMNALQAGDPTELPEDVVEDEADIWDMMRQY